MWMAYALTSLAFFFLVNRFCLNKGFIGTKVCSFAFFFFLNAFELLNVMKLTFMDNSDI